MGRYSYLIVCICTVVLMFIQYPTLLTWRYSKTVEHAQTSYFDPSKVTSYSKEELQDFLGYSDGRMKPASIASVAKEIAEKKGTLSLRPKLVQTVKNHYFTCLSCYQVLRQSWQNMKKKMVLCRGVRFQFLF